MSTVVSRSEFDASTARTKSLAMRLEVIASTTQQMTQQVAALAEGVADVHDSLLQELALLRAEQNAALSELRAEVARGHAAIVSSLQQLLARK